MIDFNHLVYYNKFNLLRWNKLQIIYLQFEFIIEIETKALSMVLLNDDRFRRLDMMLGMEMDGWSNVEIRDYFNNNNIFTPKGKRYSTNNVYMTLKKYKKRLERMKDYRVVDIEERLVLKSYQPPSFYS